MNGDKARVSGLERYLGGEDFASIVAEVPGAFVFVGACPPEIDYQTAPTNHSSKARFDDSVLPLCSSLLAALAFDQAAGCPVFSPLDTAVVASPAFVRGFWANAPRFPQHAFDRYAATVVPESPIVLNERFNIGGKGLALSDRTLVAARPLLVVTGEHDARHPRLVDQTLATYLDADFVWLPDLGIRDNGHMLMIEDNSHEIVQVLFDWLHGQGF